jgi:Fe-Mn family superoxide dismutase
MPFTLPPLPYDKAALEPHMSRKTLELHYGKHHKGYLDKLNELTAGKPEADMPIEDLIRQSHGKADKTAVFNNAAQVWNHTLFWHSMKPGGSRPDPEIERRLTDAFGSLDAFTKAFAEKAVGQFGSGYAWLVRDGDKLAVTNTPNAVPPFVNGQVPLLALDVWEHAYYVDYENRRPEFAQKWLDNLANWEFVRKRLEDPANSLPAMAA